jgi:predicted dehydrogenase
MSSTPSKRLRGVCVGAGYFSQFQYAAWARISEVEIVAACNRNVDKVQAIATHFGISKVYGIDRLDEMLDVEKPDFIDVITPPETHIEIVRKAALFGDLAPKPDSLE